ncbi:hypothetical protein Pcar_3360 [Syntrophotalea carbinolica DSM 2380]|uniref:Uncharacterized protein n=1 Tax=Syntrophotalea carbinolica (strain DSM 2380 / NBRC 103641 / GraBd1) TaxID=338963 RepID=Q0C6G3_SYNC1|nr:hypothetical protein Pcar_3360 [Syntrophotalea carbinolica DSM 2380]
MYTLRLCNMVANPAEQPQQTRFSDSVPFFHFHQYREFPFAAVQSTFKGLSGPFRNHPKTWYTCPVASR